MICNKCGALVDSQSHSPSCLICGSPIGTKGASFSIIPWEKVDDIGIIKAFLATLKLVILKPSQFFKRIDNNTVLFNAILFALTSATIGTLGNLLWSYIFADTSLYSSLSSTNIGVTTIGYTPIISIMNLIFTTLYIFVITSLTKCRKLPFSSILTAISYAQGVATLSVIPFVGIVIMPFWSIFVTIIMVAKISKVSITKALFILLLPILIIFVLFVIPFMILMGGALFSIGTLLKYYEQ